MLALRFPASVLYRLQFARYSRLLSLLLQSLANEQQLASPSSSELYVSLGCCQENLSMGCLHCLPIPISISLTEFLSFTFRNFQPQDICHRPFPCMNSVDLHFKGLVGSADADSIAKKIHFLLLLRFGMYVRLTGANRYLFCLSFSIMPSIRSSEKPSRVLSLNPLVIAP